jgi:pilus assembly protein Flp/PilA
LINNQRKDSTNMIRKFFSRLRRDKKGQGLVEYALLIAGVALISAAAVSLFGHKTSDMIGAVAAILPGAHNNDNGPIQSGHLIETAPVGTGGSIALDVGTIAGTTNADRLGQNVFGAAGAGNGIGNGTSALVVESR